MKHNYTSGPWRITLPFWKMHPDKNEMNLVLGIRGAKKETICSIFGTEKTEVEAMANSSLIQAAPELAEALQAIAAIPNKLDGADWDEIEEAREIAMAALRKAGLLPATE